MEKDLLKSRLARFPQLPAIDPDGNDLSSQEQPLTHGRLDISEDPDDELEELEELDEMPANLSYRSSKPKKMRGSPKNYEPLSASRYFSEAIEVDISTTLTSDIVSEENDLTLRVYYTPVTRNLEKKDHLSSNVLFVCVHGAGYSGLSFACFAKAIAVKNEGGVGVLAYDARGHGRSSSRSSSTQPLDMSLESMSNDLCSLLRKLFPDRSKTPSILLVGHSMGGAVVTHACPEIQKTISNVVGLVVIDVVEGTALEALSSMNKIIAAQPSGFDSPTEAIRWHVQSKVLNNLASARISVPPLLTDMGTSSSTRLIPERYVWRANLAATEPFWKGWFTGLSSKFLECKTAKLLLLAGKETLDKGLMVGQMQGKYQLEVFGDSGHCVQEDMPERTADTLLKFWKRNDRTDILAGVKKVGQV